MSPDCSQERVRHNCYIRPTLECANIMFLLCNNSVNCYFLSTYERDRLIVCIESRVDVMGSFRTTDLLTVKSRSTHGLVTVQSRSAHGLVTVRSRSSHGPITVRSRSSHSPLTVRSWASHSSPTLRCRSGKTFFAYIEMYLSATLPCLDSDVQLDTDRLCSRYAARVIFQTGCPFRRFV